jgi:hypothetical protein
MRSTKAISIVVLLLGCALLSGQGAVAEEAIAKVDPVARLVETLAASHLWRNGMYPNLELPGLYTAAVVQTDLGNKVVLLKYESAATRWWTRVYDSRPSA